MELKGPKVNVQRCTGCGRCVSACRDRRFSLEVTGYRKHAVLRQGICRRCRKCMEACAVGALVEENGA